MEHDNQVDDLDCPAPWLDIDPYTLRAVSELINSEIKRRELNIITP